MTNICIFETSHAVFRKLLPHFDLVVLLGVCCWIQVQFSIYFFRRVFTYSQPLYFRHDVRATCLTADSEEAKYHTHTHTPDTEGHFSQDSSASDSRFCLLPYRFFAVRQEVLSTHPRTGCHDSYHLNLAFTSRLFSKGG